MACDVGTTLYIVTVGDGNGNYMNETVHLTEAGAIAWVEGEQPTGVTVEWLDSTIVGEDLAGYTVGASRRRYYHVEKHLLKT